MFRKVLHNVSGVRDIEGVKRVLLEIIKVLNTSRETENRIVAEQATFIGSYTDTVWICAGSDNAPSSTENGGFHWSFGN